MSDKLNLDYYYGTEADQFAFYRVPRLLVKDGRFKKLSSDAKLLYGLMLDRMTLSMKNGWLDGENRAYIIYAVDNIMEDRGCSKTTCIKIMRELDTENGIGLIERKRRGLGKPDIIYVKNFSTIQEKSGENGDGDNGVSTEVKGFDFQKQKTFTSGGRETENANGGGDNGVSAEVKGFDFQKPKNLTSGSKETEPPEVKNLYFRRERNFTPGSKETGLLEVKNLAPNYNNNNNTDYSYNNINQINPPNHKENDLAKMMVRMDKTARISDTEAYIELIKDNIDYDSHMKNDALGDRELFDELFTTICEIVCVRHEKVRIGGEDYPYELVKSKFLKLNGSHLVYVIRCMRNSSRKVTNIRQYMITALYNAPNTINHYYEQEVRHDMLNEAYDSITEG